MVSINVVLPITCTGVIVDWAGEFTVPGVGPLLWLCDLRQHLEGQTIACESGCGTAGESRELDRVSCFVVGAWFLWSLE